MRLSAKYLKLYTYAWISRELTENIAGALDKYFESSYISCIELHQGLE
jgi:hypothetical protein